MLVTVQKGQETLMFLSDMLSSPLIVGWWISIPGHSGEWKIIEIEVK